MKKKSASSVAAPKGPIVSRGAPTAVKMRSVCPTLRVGALVLASDRNNYGHVVSIRGSYVKVYFRNPDTGDDATVEFPSYELTPIR